MAFVAIWVVGFLLFFFYPLIQTLLYSFQTLSLAAGGGLAALPTQEGVWTHYVAAFTKDPDFIKYFLTNLQQTALQTPAVVAFSLFIAIVLCHPFRGRTFMRAMFFLPVIITTGVIVDIIRTSVENVAQTGESGSNIFNAASMTAFLYEAGLPENLVTGLSGLINNSVDVVWLSGIQILLFISGLLSIPASYYEVAEVEGSTKWEAFWKITLPLIMPYILVNAVYTIVDSFSSYGNQTMRYIVGTIYEKGSISYGAALSWIYFVAVMLIIGLVFLLLRRQISKAYV